MANRAPPLCESKAHDFLGGSMMVDEPRQVPALSASAWSIDLAPIGGPVFIVLRRNETEARTALVTHLVEIGSIPNTVEAERAVAAAPIDSVGVVW